MTRAKASSSHRWQQRQAADRFVKQARSQGWRARAVFKLEEIDRRERLLRRGASCVDLGASPGSWSQYAARRVGPAGRVIAIDLLAMDPLPGVEFLLGDFTDPALVVALRQRCGDRAIDLVMSDMAPNISGNRVVDQGRSIALAEDAVGFAGEVLKPGGDLIVKLFQGSGIDEFVTVVKPQFGRVKLVKPRASRSESREIYLLARQYTL